MIPSAHRPNAFGFLRLLFASLVILSHAPELADGNRHREVLTQLFGTLSFGEVAVAGFFIVSGYLITGSYQNSRSMVAYLAKRAARIYPGFIAASLVCILIAGPLGGGQITTTLQYALVSIGNLILLRPPEVGDVFAGTPWPYIDGSMWTIAIEFRCYILLALIGCAGLLQRKRLIAVVAATVSIAAAAAPTLLGEHIETCRLAGLFLSGSTFYLYRDKLAYSRRGLAIASVGLAAGLFSVATAWLALASFGAYIVLAIAERKNTAWMRRLNSRDDISYGVYLYAWPITKVLLFYYPATPIVAVVIVTMLLAVVCGWVSWRLIERPLSQLAKARSGNPAAMAKL